MGVWFSKDSEVRLLIVEVGDSLPSPSFGILLEDGYKLPCRGFHCRPILLHSNVG